MKTFTVTKSEKKNAQDWPKDYSCSFLEQGLVSYQDVGAGIALLRKNTIDKVLNSIIGKPVVIAHQNATKENFHQHAVGYVTDAWFVPETGWFNCKFLLLDDKAKALVNQGYSVSCAFDVKGTMAGGEYHAIRYNEEISDLEFTHLALVPNPRYEDCRIMVNSKQAVIKENAKGYCEECGKKISEGVSFSDKYCSEACSVKQSGRNAKETDEQYVERMKKIKNPNNPFYEAPEKKNSDSHLSWIMQNIEDLLSKIKDAVRGNAKENAKCPSCNQLMPPHDDGKGGVYYKCPKCGRTKNRDDSKDNVGGVTLAGKKSMLKDYERLISEAPESEKAEWREVIAQLKAEIQQAESQSKTQSKENAEQHKCDRCGKMFPLSEISIVEKGGIKSSSVCRSCADKAGWQMPKNQSKEPKMFGLFKGKQNDKISENSKIRVNGEEFVIGELLNAMTPAVVELQNSDVISDDAGVKHNVGELIANFKAKNGTTEKGDPLPADADKVNEKEEEKVEKKEDAKEEEKPEDKKEDAKACSCGKDDCEACKKNAKDEEEKKEKKEDAKAEGDKAEEKKEGVEKSEKEHSKESEAQVQKAEEDKSKKKETMKEETKEEEKLTVKKESSKKENHFEKLNALKEGAEAERAVMADTINLRIDRGNERYGSKEKKESK